MNIEEIAFIILFAVFAIFSLIGVLSVIKGPPQCMITGQPYNVIVTEAMYR